MKRKIEKVTPKAGTLKHANQFVRTGKNVAGKLSAFVLTATMAFTSMSFVQDDASLKSASFSAADTIEKVDSCCTVSKPAAKRNERNVFRLTGLPTSEMIRKSDSEAFQNLRSSLTENKLKSLKFWMNISDLVIDREFKSETSVNMTGYFSSNSADVEIGEQFQAENINMGMSKMIDVADADMNDLFVAEVAGITTEYHSVAVADEEVNQSFVVATTSIDYPSADMIAAADMEVHANYTQDLKGETFASTKAGKK